MVWIKNRNDTKSHQVFDTNRGPGNVIHTNDSVQAADDIETLSSFSSNGFTVGTRTGVNAQNNNYVAWNFAAAAGFFDVVTYDSKNAVQTIPHELGSAPGMMIIKDTEADISWGVYHKDLATNELLMLDNSSAKFTDNNIWNNTAPTDTVFTVGDQSMVNNTTDSHKYVAYLFADNPDGGIKCGYVTGNNAAPETVSIGFKPGWLLWKDADDAYGWIVFDGKRLTTSDTQAPLFPDTNAPEDVGQSYLTFTDDGFTVQTINRASDKHIYVAIADCTVRFYDENTNSTVTNHTLTKRYGVDPLETDLRKQGIYPLTEQPTYAVDTYVKEGDAYNPVRDYTSEINAANAKVEALLARVQALEAEEEGGNGGGY